MSARDSVSASVQENEFTAPFLLAKDQKGSISLSGTFSATVTIQRRVDGAAWRDVDSWTAATEKDFYASEAQEIRIGIKTGDYTSGAADVRLGR